MSAPETPAAVAEVAVAAAGATDAADLARILADDEDIEAARLAIIARHALDTGGPVMLALARMAALTEQVSREVSLIRRYLGGA